MKSEKTPRPKGRLLLWGAIGLVVLAAIGFGVYRTWIEKPTQRQIDEAVAASDWNRVVRLINRADVEQDDGRNFYRLGQAYERLGDQARALRAYMEADDRGFRPSEVRYRVSSIYAKQGEDALAMQWLFDAYEVGLSRDMVSDPAVQRLESSEAWRKRFGEDSVAGAEAAKGLDFLVGTWSVTRNNGGTGFGNRTVTVSRLLDGAIGEEWQTDVPDGATGLFVFDPELKRWSYTYVDGYGRVFEGNVRFASNLVTIAGTLTHADGTEILRRIEVRSSSGVVDYIVLDSRDKGETWDDSDKRRLTATTDGSRPSF